MRLEKVLIHRLIRVMRVIIPLLLVVLVSIPAWNFVSRRILKPSGIAAQQFPRDLSVLSEGVTFSRTEGGRTQFTVHAKTNLGFKDNKNVLEDVDVTVFGTTDSEPTRRIRSKNCTYDEQTNNIRFTGDVQVQLDDKTSARTEELTYNEPSRIIASPQRTTIEQPEVVAAANALEYQLNTSLLKLDGDVRIVTAARTTMETASVIFDQNENWAAAAGGVVVKSRSGFMRGATGRADLEPGTYRPKTILVEGDVTAESKAPEEQDTWKIRAASVETTVSAAGTAELVKARGNVRVEKIAAVRQILTGGAIDAALGPSGKLELLHAREAPQMVFGDGRRLHSSEIETNGAGFVRTADNSTLQLGDSVITGKQFRIQIDEVITFTTSERAHLQSGERQSSADRTEAHFDSRTSSLLELVQTGNFQFSEGMRAGRAQNARFEDGGAVVTLDGAPVVTDSQMRLEAGHIRLNQKDSSFVAAKNVKTVTINSGERVLVRSGQAEGTAESVVYTGNAQLWRGTVFIRGERLAASTRDSRLQAEGKVQSNIESIRAASDRLDFDDKVHIAHYTGNVRAQKQDMVLQTADMTVKLRENEIAEIIAVGAVTVTRGEQRGTGEEAVYDAATDSVVLTGKNAQVHDRQHGTVQGARLVMKTTGASVTVEGGSNERVLTKRAVTKTPVK
jgi:LPS export ABC transporter protein LptC/lipopolysaccharide transport protein LptA